MLKRIINRYRMNERIDGLSFECRTNDHRDCRDGECECVCHVPTEKKAA